MTPVRDQGICNSAYAFAAATVLEYANNLQEPLSAQNLVDSINPQEGCNAVKQSDNLAAVMRFAEQAGVAMEKFYPYGVQGPEVQRRAAREEGSIQVAGALDDYEKIYGKLCGNKIDGNEAQLKKLLGENGPGVVLISKIQNFKIDF